MYQLYRWTEAEKYKYFVNKTAEFDSRKLIQILYVIKSLRMCSVTLMLFFKKRTTTYVSI